MNQNEKPSPEPIQPPDQQSAAAPRQPSAPEASATAKSRNQTAGIDFAEYIPTGPAPTEDARYRYEELTEANAPAVNALYQEVFREERSAAHYRWKFLDDQHRPGLATVGVEKATGRVVGVNNGRPRRFRVAGHDFEFLQVCETATAPDARSLSLFRKVTFGVALQARDRGVRFAYGGRTSEAAARLGAKVFRYRTLFELPTWERRLRLRAAFQRRFGRFWGRLFAAVGDRFRRVAPAAEEQGWEFERVVGFGPEFDRLWGRLRDRYRVAAVRDARALDYRYTQCPVGEHRVWLARSGGEAAGFVVVRLWQRDGVRLATALDWLAGRDERLLRALFSRACRDAADCGADFFHVAALPDSPAGRALAGLPGCRVSRREPLDRVVCCMLPFCGEPGEDEATLLEAYDPEAWHYTQGDSDFHD